MTACRSSNGTARFAICLQATVDVEVVLVQQLLPPLGSCGSQLDVADCDLSAGLDGLQSSEADSLLAEGLHSIGAAGVVDEGSCRE